MAPGYPPPGVARVLNVHLTCSDLCCSERSCYLGNLGHIILVGRLHTVSGSRNVCVGAADTCPPVPGVFPPRQKYASAVLPHHRQRDSTQGSAH